MGFAEGIRSNAYLRASFDAGATILMPRFLIRIDVNVPAGFVRLHGISTDGAFTERMTLPTRRTAGALHAELYALLRKRRAGQAESA
jgi:hypothetical protein